MTTQDPQTQSQTSPMEVILQLLRDNNELRKENAELRLQLSKNGSSTTAKSNRTPIRTLDTVTGKVYPTHSAAGMEVAPEYGLPIHNFVWYELVKGTKEKPAKCPNRFRDISEAEYEKMVKAAEEFKAAQEVKAAEKAAAEKAAAEKAAAEKNHQNKK